MSVLHINDLRKVTEGAENMRSMTRMERKYMKINVRAVKTYYYFIQKSKK